MLDFDEQPWDKKPKHVAPSSAKESEPSKMDSDFVRGRHARTTSPASDTRPLPHHLDDKKNFDEFSPKNKMDSRDTRELQDLPELVISREQDIPSHSSIFELPKKKSIAKRIVLIVLAVLLVLLGAGAAYAGWYTHQLNNALSMDEDKEKSVQEVLAAGDLGEPFYMLLLGSDSREGSGTSDNPAHMGDNERSDVMILVRVDTSNRQITMLSIPRDTPITVPGGAVAKINEAYNIGGAAYSIEKVSELTGVPISHYAEVHFSEFEELVDKIGGVTVDVPVEMSYKDALTGEKVTIYPGEQTLNGQQAQIFARSRKVYEGNQDAQRQNGTRLLVVAILDKVLSKPVHELPGTVLDLAQCVGTDLKSDEIVSLAMSYASGSGKMTVYSGSGPTSGDIDAATGLWLCYENPEGWSKIMAVVDSGEDPKNIDVEDSAIIPSDCASGG